MERFHRVLKNALRAQHNQRWFDHLPLILLSLRNSYSTSIGTTPAKLVFKTPLRLPGEVFQSEFLCDVKSQAKNVQNRANIKSYIPKSLNRL